MADGLNWFIELSGEGSVELPAIEETPPSPELRVGERLAGRFELLGLLGEGGMGAVYHARELASGRSVAVKLLNGTITPSQQERFRREGVVTAALGHPGIVAVHGAGAVDGSPFLVYEYVPGGRTLRDLLRGEATREELLVLLRDAAEALGAAHAAGVVHRDVKPGNLLVDPEGRIRVADFGLARAVGLESLTQSGEMLGTPLYMPREQFDHDREAVGPTADVWALGVILHEVITGAPPFESRGLVELVGAIQHAPIEPRRLAPELEPGLEAICKRALQRAPSARYPDAAAFAADLTRFLAGEAPLAAGARRGRGGVLVAVGLALVAGVGALALSAQPNKGELARTLEAVEAGRADAAALASALAADPGADAALRAAAHLRLAEGPGAPCAVWERRLAHARQAAALDPRRGAAAEGLAARALVELGRYDEAARAFAEARERGRAPARVLEDAELLVGCSRWAEAAAALRAYDGADPRARRLALEAKVGALDAPTPASLPEQVAELSRSAQVVVRARLMRTLGGDPGSRLEARAVARPGDDEVASALIRLHLERAELAEAQAAFARARAAGFGVPGLGPALEALRRRRTEPARRLTRPWKLAVGRGLARLARRELDLARRTEDPRCEVGAGALAPERRRARARRYLSFLRQELAGEGLEPSDRPSPASAALKRARAELEAGRPTQALALVERFVTRRDADLGSYEELRAVAAALGGARPSARKRLLWLTSAVPPVELPPETPGEDDTPPEGPPYDWNALYQRAALRLRREPQQALPAMALAVARAPRLFRNLRHDLFHFARANRIVGSAEDLSSLADALAGATWAERLARATLRALAAEWEGAPATTHDLDEVLAEAPGVVFARVLRALMRVRLGRTLAAREDLAVVREVFPDDLLTTALVRAFLRAREGAPPARVEAALRDAAAKGFRPGEFWKPEEYPELVPYLKHDAIRALLTRREERRAQRRAAKRR